LPAGAVITVEPGVYLPERGWPTAYGIAHSAVPEPYPAQLVFPFTRRPVTR